MRRNLITLCSALLITLVSCKRSNDIKPSSRTALADVDMLNVDAVAAPLYTPVVIAGKTNTPGYLNGTELKARFNAPTGIFVNKDGSLLVADLNNKAIRKISITGIVSTIVQDRNLGWATDLASINNGTIALLAGSAIFFYKNGILIQDFDYHTEHAGITGLDKDPSGNYFWYTDFFEVDDGTEIGSLGSIKPDLTSPAHDTPIPEPANSLSISISGNKFMTSNNTIYEVTNGGVLSHLLPNTRFDSLTCIAANKDATKLYLVDKGDIKVVTKCKTCKTNVTKLVSNVDATGIALSNSEKVLFFTSLKRHTVSKINLP